MFGFVSRANMIMSYFIFITYISLFSCGHTEIIFQLTDSEINEVVCRNETDITLNCLFNGNGTTDVTLQIEDLDGKKLVVSNQTMQVEYTIQNATMEDGRVYTCRATYNCMNGNNANTTATLQFNVQDESELGCHRNGTVVQPGDWLLLLRYCRDQVNCSWSFTVNGTEPEQVISIDRGEVIWMLVQYTSDIDNYTIYDCCKDTQTCEIKSLVNSSRFTIINLIDNVQAGQDCVAVTTETSTPLEGANITDNDDNNSSLTTTFLIGGAVVIVLILFAIIVIVLICIYVVSRIKIKRKRKEEDDINTKIIAHDDEKQDWKAADNDKSSYYQVTDDICLYDAPPMNDGMKDNQDGENYAEVKGPESSRPQPTNEKYDEINQSDISQPPSDMTYSKTNSNYDESELGASNVNEEQVGPTAPDRVLYATIDRSKSTRNTKHREVASKVSDEEPVTYATVDKKMSRRK